MGETEEKVRADWKKKLKARQLRAKHLERTQNGVRSDSDHRNATYRRDADVEAA